MTCSTLKTRSKQTVNRNEEQALAKTIHTEGVAEAKAIRKRNNALAGPGGETIITLKITEFLAGKGDMMSKELTPKKLEQLMAEADELVGQINSEAIEDMAEAHRIQFEKHAQNLAKIKSEVQGNIENKEAPGLTSGADGVHEAILDIVKAMQNFQKKRL